MDTTTTGLTSPGVDDAPTYRQEPAWFLACNITFAFLAIIGNTVVCVTVYKVRSLHTTTNYFIASLAIADLLTAVCYLPYPRPTHLPDNTAGLLFCKLWLSGYIQWIFFTASVFNLMVLTLERYVAICHPLRYRTWYSRKRAKVYMAVAWLSPVVLETFCIYSHPFVHGTCEYNWFSEAMRIFVGWGIFLTTYLVPCIVMFVSYIWIYRSLHAKEKALSRHNQHNPALTVLRIRKKMVRTLCVVFITFALCWGPNHLYFLAVNAGASVKTGTEVYEVTVLLAFMNACLNPFIYSFTNSTFRQALRKVFCCDNKTAPGENSIIATHSITETVTSRGEKPTMNGT